MPPPADIPAPLWKTFPENYSSVQIEELDDLGGLCLLCLLQSCLMYCVVHVCIYLCSDLNLAGGGSSSSTALVATGPISLDSSSSEEYSPGFITGDEIVTEQGIDSNIASIFLACILCLCYV